jgi:hypothetical protein
MEYERDRAQVLDALAPQLSRAIPVIADHVQHLENQERQHLLHFLATEAFLGGDVVQNTAQIVSAVASHVIEICDEWKWM